MVCSHHTHCTYRSHWTYFLVDLINKYKLDPVTMYTTPKISAMLIREEVDLPPRGKDEEIEVYREKLTQVRQCAEMQT